MGHPVEFEPELGRVLQAVPGEESVALRFPAKVLVKGVAAGGSLPHEKRGSPGGRSLLYPARPDEEEGEVSRRGEEKVQARNAVSGQGGVGAAEVGHARVEEGISQRRQLEIFVVAVGEDVVGALQPARRVVFSDPGSNFVVSLLRVLQHLLQGLVAGVATQGRAGPAAVRKLSVKIDKVRDPALEDHRQVQRTLADVAETEGAVVGPGGRDLLPLVQEATADRKRRRKLEALGAVDSVRADEFAAGAVQNVADAEPPRNAHVGHAVAVGADQVVLCQGNGQF